MFMVLLPKSILVTWKFIKHSQHISVSWCHWMVSSYLCLNAGCLLKTFCRPGGRPRGILANVSWRFETYWNTVQWSIVCNCDLTTFLSAFVFMGAVNSFQSSDYLTERNSDFFSVKACMQPLFCFCFCSIFSSPAFYSLFLMKVTSSSLPCSRIYSTHWYFLSQIEKDATSCPFSTYSMLFSFGAVIRETTL